MKKFLMAPLSVLGGLMVSGMVMAQTTPGVPDVTAVTGAITTDTTNVGTIGGGVLLIGLSIAGYHWIKRAF